MRKGRIIKGLAFAITAVMLLGCFSASYTSARTQGWTDHIDIRTNAAFINDGNQSNVTITKDNITYVGYKTGNASQFTDLFEHNDKLSSGRDKYETKFGSEKYGADLFKVADETAVVRIAGTYSNGEAFDVTIGQQDVYPDNTYIEYKNTSNGTENAMKSYGATVENLTINGKKADYYNVSGCSILKVGVAMCNGVSFSGGKVVPCGIDLYISPKVIESFDELTVKKNWTNLEGSLIPSNVTVQLFKDDVAVEGKTATLSADNDWTAVIKYTKEDAEYTVKEIAIDGVPVENTAYASSVAKNESLGATNTTFDGTIEMIDNSKNYYDIYSKLYYVANEENTFAISKLTEKGEFVIWTGTPITDDNKQAFIDAVNTNGAIKDSYPNDVLTVDNCHFYSGLDVTFDYGEYIETAGVTGVDNNNGKTYKSKKDADKAIKERVKELKKQYKDFVEVSSNATVKETNGSVAGYSRSNKSYDDYAKCLEAMNKAKDDLRKKYSLDKGYELIITTENDPEYREIGAYATENDKWYYYYNFSYQAYKVTKFGCEINFTYTDVIDTRGTKTLSFKNPNYFQFCSYDDVNSDDVVLNYSDRTDWAYLYSGTYASEQLPSETTYVVSNTYNNNTSITGSKTFDMQNQSDIAVPVNADGTPNIDIEVYKNNAAVSDFNIVWERVGTTNTWNFTITGDAITKYYDSDSNDKLDSVASYTVKEAGEEDGVINIDNFDYNVVYGDNNAITNTLDTSSFVGDLTINKTIDDVNPVNGKAIFTYKVEGQGKTYYAVIVVDSETKTGSTTLKGLKIGNYTVTELNTMRFAQTSVTPNGGAASVTRNGEATVDFTNALKVRTNFSHTDVTVNHFTKTADGISISEENDDDPTVETTRTAIVAPAYR